MFRWLIHRKSTASQQVIPTPKATLDIVTQLTDDFLTLRHRVQRLEIALKEALESHESLSAQVHKLRGQVHGARGGRPPAQGTLDGILPGDKESLRAYAGLRAGARYTHQE